MTLATPLFRAITILAVMLMCAGNTALADNTVKRTAPVQQISPDVKQLENQRYKLVGNDPFFVLRLAQQDQQEQQQRVDALLIELSLSGGNKAEQLNFEVFYKANSEQHHAAQAISFDALYRFSFSHPSDSFEQPMSRILVALPSALDISTASLVRLDIDGCTGCITDIASIALVNSQTLTPSQAISIRKFYNGVTPISSDGENIELAGWTLNDLVADSVTPNGFARLKITGADPYLVSPRLEFATDQLGGVLFNLSAPPELDDIAVQLFYATDKHGFSEAASSLIRVSRDQIEQGFVVPLNFLGTQSPRQRMIERLRLDIDSPSAGSWQLNKVQLLHQSQLAEYSSLVPNRLLQRKIQRARGLDLAFQSLQKIARDKAFIIAYLLLLALTSLYFYRSFRR